jgi:DNA-binding NtrC family response regulator
MTRVLIVDDDPVQLRLAEEVVRRGGFSPVLATGGRQALDLLRADPLIAVVILDLVMPDLDGMAVLGIMGREGIATPVIVQTAHSSLDTVVNATRQGAVDFFVKPVMPERLIVSLRNAVRIGALEAALRADRARAANASTIDAIPGRSAGMDRVRQQAAKAARSPLPVLIEGEAGTGKHMLARAIHGSGDRAGRAFVTLDATAGGDVDRLAAAIAEAQGGTLYVREAGELEDPAQAALAAFLDSGELRIGAGRALRFNVRIIAGSTRRLVNLARSGQVREDMFYKLGVMPIYLPPLRDRRADIGPIAERALLRISAELGRRIVGLSPEALALLSGHAWPGNLRQLDSALFRAAALGTSGLLEASDFPQLAPRDDGEAAPAMNGVLHFPSSPVHVDVAMLPRREEKAPAAPDRFVADGGEVAGLGEVEKALIAFALERHGRHMSRVARVLGIGRSTLYRKLREYGLDEGLESDAA